MSNNLLKKAVQKFTLSPFSKIVWIRPFLFPARLFLDMVKELRFDVYQISGERPLFFISSTELYPFFITHFCKDAHITKTGEVYLWDLRKFIRKNDPGIIEMHKYLVPLFPEGIITFRWIRQELDLSESLSTITRHIRKKNKIFQFHPEISTDIDQMKIFYETIFIPYIKKRYKDAFLDNFEIFSRSLANNHWELVLIKREGLLIGGACCSLINSTFYWRINALIDEYYLKEEAMAAIYYYSIARAKEKNAKVIDFGQSRPFLSDGVLRYKKKWGAKIIPDHSSRIVYLQNLKTEGMIIEDDGKLKTVLFSEQHAHMKPYSNSGLEVKILE